jgi:hypothetical protein
MNFIRMFRVSRMHAPIIVIVTPCHTHHLDAVEFVSRRAPESPYTVMFYVDGVLNTRTSTCCESRHGVGKRLGGPSGQFSVVRVNGCHHPCLRSVHQQTIDFTCDNRRFWLSAHSCQAPANTAKPRTIEQQIRIVGAD